MNLYMCLRCSTAYTEKPHGDFCPNCGSDDVEELQIANPNGFGSRETIETLKEIRDAIKSTDRSITFLAETIRRKVIG